MNYAVIFDMDGVLVDSYHAHFQSWRSSALRLGLDMTEEQFAKTFGRTSRDIIHFLWPGRFTDQQAAEFDNAKEADYRDVLRKSFPEMRGAGALIAQLHQAGFRLAIGSSGPPENVEVVRQCIPNGNLFDATVNGSEVKHGKPDPQVFLLAAKKLGIDPPNCAVIEDAIFGIEAARRANMTAIALTGTAPREELAKRAHRVVDSLTQLSPRVISDLIASNQ
ncbi:MAG TPA: HAD family phosphatase [Tepidisphaeraceae bacterium]|nr:HAD family phosphatase [Tepidisphaeraceae bacterium]